MATRGVQIEPPVHKRWLGPDQGPASLFLLPVFAVLCTVAVFPILYSFYTSLFSLNLIRPHRTRLVWFDNYINVLQEPVFWTAVGRTTTYTLVCVTGTTILALGVALLLNEVFRGRRLLAALLLVPWATPSVVNGLMWKWIYEPTYGSLNGLLLQLGVIDGYRQWLSDPSLTIFLIANAAIWKQMPLAAILLLVSMKAIPDDLYRAAKVDGANVFQRFTHVTLPSLKSGFMLVLIYETMISIRHFDLFMILTEGGPGDASYVMSWYIYVETFRSLNFGLGATLSYILAIATFALSYLFIRTLGRRAERAV
jgi:multiple sugar transport system permease protein